jgi:hypothetical protein
MPDLRQILAVGDYPQSLVPFAPPMVRLLDLCLAGWLLACSRVSLQRKFPQEFLQALPLVFCTYLVQTCLLAIFEVSEKPFENTTGRVNRYYQSILCVPIMDLCPRHFLKFNRNSCHNPTRILTKMPPNFLLSEK